jgi:tetratricopeptide (TPR) repeat protein
MANKSDIENEIKDKGDFVKIDHLNRYLKTADSMDLKKYIHLRIAGIYESKNFLSDATKNIESAADISLTFKEKMDLYMKATELWIKASSFDYADKSFAKALAHGNSIEKDIMKQRYFDLYSTYAKIAENNGKHRIAVNIYEKLISLPQAEPKRAEIKSKLLSLYQKLGRLADYRRVSNIPDPKVVERPKIALGSFEDLGIKKY